MIFCTISKNIWHWEHTWGPHHLATRVQGAPTPLGRAPCLVDPLHLFQHLHTSSSSRKNHPPAQTRVLAHLAAIFDLLAQSSIHKTALGDCSSVCGSSNCPISFCSSALFIAIFFCLADPVLELACQIYVVKSSSNAWYVLYALVGVVAINLVEFDSLLFWVTKNLRNF